MKITKQKMIDYDSLGYSEANGWFAMCNWDRIKNIIKWGNRIITLFFSLITILIFNLFFDLKIETYSLDILIFILTFFLIYFLLIVPLHEMLHLVAYIPNIFSNKCHIMI